MNNKFPKSWFSGTDSKFRLSKFLDQELDAMLKNLTDHNLYANDNENYVYKSAVAGGLIVCYRYIQHTCVDKNINKPWIVRKQQRHKLDFKEFKEYTNNVVLWLNKMPPNTNYASLVHTQTIITFLTTMEFTDA